MASVKTSSVPQPVVLPDATDKYDTQNERETRRIISKAMQQLMQWGSISALPASIGAVAELDGESDTFPYFTSVSAMALAALTPYARTILACADAATMRDTLGLGDLAVLDKATESDLDLSDVTTQNVGGSQHGFAPKSPNDPTTFLNGDSAPDYAQVKDSDLSLSDIVTNDVSIARHGFVPKLPADPNKYLDGDGLWSVPAGGGSAPPTFPSISGLELRLSAANSIVTLATDGRVTAVTDLSGNGRNAAQSGSNRPLFFQRAFNNGYPCFGFDGGVMRLATVLGTTIPSPLTVVLVMMNYTGGTPSEHLYRDDAGGAVGFNSGGSTWAMFNGSVVGSTTLYSQNQVFPLPARTRHATVRMDVYNGPSSIMTNNSSEVSVGDAGTSAGGVHTNFAIGTGFDGGVPDQGAAMLLYEVLLFSRAITLTERDQLRAYYSDPLIAGLDLI